MFTLGPCNVRQNHIHWVHAMSDRTIFTGSMQCQTEPYSLGPCNVRQNHIHWVHAMSDRTIFTGSMQCQTEPYSASQTRSTDQFSRLAQNGYDLDTEKGTLFLDQYHAGVLYGCGGVFFRPPPRVDGEAESFAARSASRLRRRTTWRRSKNRRATGASVGPSQE